MSKVSQEVIDTLFESIVEMITYNDGETIANIFYDKNPELINNNLGLSTKQDFIDFIDKTNSMTMKHAEYAIDTLIKSIFKIARDFKPKEIESFIIDYLDENFSLS